MNKLQKYLSSIGLLIFMVVMDALIYYGVYVMGFTPMIEAFGMTPPEIPCKIFILFACMLHVFKAGSNNGDSYESDDPKLFWRLTSLYMSKFFVMALLFILYAFTKYLM